MAKRDESAIAALFESVQEMQKVTPNASDAEKHAAPDNSLSLEEDDGIQLTNRNMITNLPLSAGQSIDHSVKLLKTRQESKKETKQKMVKDSISDDFSGSLSPQLRMPTADTGDVLQEAVNAIEEKLKKEGMNGRFDRVTFLLRKDLNVRLNQLCKSKPRGFKSQIFNSVVELILSQYEKC